MLGYAGALWIPIELVFVKPFGEACWRACFPTFLASKACRAMLARACSSKLYNKLHTWLRLAFCEQASSTGLTTLCWRAPAAKQMCHRCSSHHTSESSICYQSLAKETSLHNAGARSLADHTLTSCTTSDLRVLQFKLAAAVLCWRALGPNTLKIPCVDDCYNGYTLCATHK